MTKKKIVKNKKKIVKDKKVAKKNTVVVIYDSYDRVEEVKLFSRKDARIYCIEHNLSTLLNRGPWDEKEAEIVETIHKLIINNKWNEVFRLWDKLGQPGYEFDRGADWYPLN